MEDKRDLYRADRDLMSTQEFDQRIQNTLKEGYDRVNRVKEREKEKFFDGMYEYTNLSSQELEVEQEQPNYPDWSKLTPVRGFSASSGRYLRYDLIPMDVLKEVVEVLTFGEEKHVQNAQGEGKSWTAGQLYSVRINKILRHLTSFIEGDIIDSESDRHALAHVIVQAMLLLGMDLTGNYNKFDDRATLNGRGRLPSED